MKIWAQNIQNWARKDRTARLYLAVRMAADGPYGLSLDILNSDLQQTSIETTLDKQEEASK